MEKRRERIFLIGIFFLFAIIISGNVNAVCCEKTLNGGTCLDAIDSSYCSTANNPATGNPFRVDDTGCSSTLYCSNTGTCVNNVDGTCMTSTQSACDTSLGGYYDARPITEVDGCKLGCCLIGDGWSLVGKVTCDATKSKSPGVDVEFHAEITDAATCAAASGPTSVGACVSQGGACTITSKSQCANPINFHSGLLCTAPQLGTTCTRIQNTTCVQGKNEVYFTDSCGNIANVYNATLYSDDDYWTYIKDPSSSSICGYGSANINNPDCGNCNYGAGSTCGTAQGTGVNPTIGNYVCRDLNCNYKGQTIPHGSTWCSEPISDFENALPGQLSYRLSCFNGEVQSELCGNDRSSLCNDTGKDALGRNQAVCTTNTWQLCSGINSTKDCLNPLMNCKILSGVSYENASAGNILMNDNQAGGTGGMIQAACVPKYPPGFDFWEPDTKVNLGNNMQLSPSDVCGRANAAALAGYHGTVAYNTWFAIDGNCFAQCVDACKNNIDPSACQELCFNGVSLNGQQQKCAPSDAFSNVDQSILTPLNLVSIKSDWATARETLANALGDCGVKANYIGKDGYNSWNDLFIGDNITRSSIPNYDKYQ
ncbi:MAG TPA: hypothetical protein VMC07_00035 [Candidatus Omnitrophota bacterium]|nr:hypothetical protein [Candidatus Omnitrophota bacterium]